MDAWRKNYEAYMASPAWAAKRAEWASSGSYPHECYVCGNPGLDDKHFHHRTYKNLGHERLAELVPVCVPCHVLIHLLRDNHDPKLNLWNATSMARAKVRPDAEPWDDEAPREEPERVKVEAPRPTTRRLNRRAPNRFMSARSNTGQG